MAHEGRTYASRASKFTPRPETPEERDTLDRLPLFAGELLTVEFIRVILLKSKIIVGVRYDENTAFEIDMFKAEWELLIKAGYEIPSTVGQHPFHAEIVTEWVKEFPRGMRHSTVWVAPKAQETKPTPLQAQSAIFYLLRHDAHLQKLVHGVTMHHDLHGAPIVRIQCNAASKGIIETVVNPMAEGVALLWSVMERKPFYGAFDITDKIPSLDTIELPKAG